jgi:murein DD-endopeptidase MepM/ murein hydrolase activator NlpD
MPAAAASRRHAVEASAGAHGTGAGTARTTPRCGATKHRAPVSKLSALPKGVVLLAAGTLLTGAGSVAALTGGHSPPPAAVTASLSGSFMQAGPSDEAVADDATIAPASGAGAHDAAADAAVSVEQRVLDSQAVSRSTERNPRQLRQATLTTRAEQQADKRSDALAELTKKAQQRARQIDADQWVLPVRSYTLTATFGESSGLWSSTHTGLDFAAPSGARIYAIAGGKVVRTSYEGAYGNQTVVRLPDGTEMWYCHQTSFVAREGQTVGAGDLIGYVGTTGNSTGAHLHLEVRPGGKRPVDPFDALAAHGVRP